jgi:hypothetical protein
MMEVFDNGGKKRLWGFGADLKTFGSDSPNLI